MFDLEYNILRNRYILPWYILCIIIHKNIINNNRYFLFSISLKSRELCEIAETVWIREVGFRLLGVHLKWKPSTRLFILWLLSRNSLIFDDFWWWHREWLERDFKQAVFEFSRCQSRFGEVDYVASFHFRNNPPL